MWKPIVTRNPLFGTVSDSHLDVKPLIKKYMQCLRVKFDKTEDTCEFRTTTPWSQSNLLPTKSLTCVIKLTRLQMYACLLAMFHGSGITLPYIKPWLMISIATDFMKIRLSNDLSHSWQQILIFNKSPKQQVILLRAATALQVDCFMTQLYHYGKVYMYHYRCILYR
jgi:hypothetical protein